jgi:hypothetical protein
MLRIALVAFALAWVNPTPAGAVLAYQRPATPQGVGNGKVVVARDDGSKAYVVATGHDPAVSPNGRWVAYVVSHRRAFDSLRVVRAHGGRSYRLLKTAFVHPGLPIAWSPDSRRVIVANGPGDPVLIDVLHAKTKLIRWNADLIGASFSPDGRQAALFGDGAYDLKVDAINLRTGRRRHVAGGSYEDPIWGRAGIALGEGNEARGTEPVRSDLVLVPSPGRRARLVLSDANPIDWAPGGNRILGERVASDGVTVTALVVTLEDRSVRRFPQIFSSVAALSNDSRVVLGEINGDVVAARSDGSTTVLAHNAGAPTWTH